MAYPNNKPESRIVMMWNWNSKIIVPDHNSMQSLSLKMYLEQYANTYKISNITTVTEEIMHIYKSLKKTYVMSDSVMRNDPTLWCANALPKVRSIPIFYQECQ